ncbi:MAG: hypothetical protein JSU81_04505 [Candidatus Coatesbacteria bacterium]|nr:MAG: hypothetical protein JSU81_04505 [Candidatus Coatesbacteria bacterium]
MAQPGAFEFDRFQGLSREAQYKIDAELRTLYERTEASLLILSEKSGRIVSVEGGLNGLDASVLSAVSASFFAALAEIGNLIGERRRSAYQYFEGENYKIYLSFVNDDFFLTAIFAGRVPLGLVRTYSNQALKTIRTWLLEVELNATREEAARVVDTEFAAEVDLTLDELLGDDVL